MQKLAFTYTISGRVQGVGYRWFTVDAAKKTGVCGTVRNLLNGSVEVHAQATESSLEIFKGLLEEGPALARVDSIAEARTNLIENLNTFKVVG